MWHRPMVCGRLAPAQLVGAGTEHADSGRLRVERVRPAICAAAAPPGRRLVRGDESARRARRAAGLPPSQEGKGPRFQVPVRGSPMSRSTPASKGRGLIGLTEGRGPTTAAKTLVQMRQRSSGQTRVICAAV